jgi:serine/threonine protein kinase
MPRLTAFQTPTEGLTISDGKRVRLIHALGKGSVASVWKGVVEADYGVRRVVAVKLFASMASDDLDSVLPELARAVARTACVRHPNVVDVYEFGVWQAQPFLVEELVDGVTLVELVRRFAERRKRLPLDVALFIASEIAEALSGARTARDEDGVQLGVLHLGLTPRDVLLSWRGEVKVCDFELSVLRGASSSVRSIAGVASRANMMAPEVAQGQPGDARSDVFALGVLVRELLIGPRLPAGLSNPDALRLARVGHVEPMTFQPHLPEALLSVLQRALMVEPGDRYPNASAMAAELRRIALAMGVGDGRWFLRRALDHEWGSDPEITQEVQIHPADDAAEEYGGGRPGRASPSQAPIYLVPEHLVEDDD